MLEFSEEAFEGFGVLRSLKANSADRGTHIINLYYSLLTLVHVYMYAISINV